MPKRSFSADPLPGAVVEQWFRCGKPNCRCAAGKRHGPYYVRMWREGGRLKKQYVRAADLEEVRERCEARREHNRQFRQSLAQIQEGLAALRALEQLWRR